MSINKKSGFINLCFPLSFTILTFLLGWPQIILYQFGYKTSTELLDMNFIATGTIANLLVLLVIGILVDTWRKKKGYLSKKYYMKLPILLIIIGLLLFAISFIDKTCA